MNKQNIDHIDIATYEDDFEFSREEAFERISKLRPLPVTEKLPDSAELLAQVREESAR